MTLPLPANWTTGSSWTAASEDNVETVLTNLGNGTLVIPRRPNSTGAASLTLSNAYNAYIHTGSGATWTLPAISGNTGVDYLLYNRGTGSVTVQRAGADQLYSVGAAVTSITIPIGGVTRLFNDGTYWLVQTQAASVPSYDNSHLYGGGGNSGQTVTWTQTVGAGGPFGVVAVCNNNSWVPIGQTGMDDFASLVSFGGVSCPLIGTKWFTWQLGGQMWISVYGAPNIPAGTQTVSVRLTQSGCMWTGPAASATYLGISGAGAINSTGNYPTQYAGTDWWLNTNVNRQNANPGRMFLITAYNNMATLQFISGTTRQSVQSFAIADCGTSGPEAHVISSAYSWDYESQLVGVDLYSGT